MRVISRPLKLFSIFVVVLLLLIVTGLGSVLADKLIFYARVARLSMEEPDRKLAMPLEDVSKRQIADTWHAPRGTDRLHEGQDIFAPKGTPVLSATKGFVYNVGENNLGGQTVSVIGAGGRVYYYAHLDAYAPGLHVGDRVNTRTVLGYVGTTGNAPPNTPHLHFAIALADEDKRWWAGTPLDPLPLLRLAEDPSRGPVAIGDSGSILQRPLRVRRRHP